jgi:phage protein D
VSDGTFSNLLHVTIDGAPLPSVLARLLVEGWVDVGAGVPGAFQLTFRDPKKLVLKQFGIRIGVPVVLAAVADGQGKGSPLLTGEVTGLESDYDGTGTFTIVRGYDLGHRLLRQRRVAAYRNMSASDIARALAAKDQVPIGRVDTTATVYESITQPNTTDWDFLSRLADENETVLSISPEGRFELVRPAPAAGGPSESATAHRSHYVLQAGVNIMRCRASVTSADQVTGVQVRGWDVTTKRTLTGLATAASNPGAQIGTTPAKAVTAFGDARLVGTDAPYDRQAEVNHAAGALADDVTSAFSELEVIVRGDPRLRPGVPVTLTDVGDPFEGKYTVTAVRHLFPVGSRYETWVTVSGRQWRSLYGLVSGGASTAPRLPSVANALVTDVQDPLQQGRVKLRFPWLDDLYVSDWTRTVQFGGAGGGGVISPDVGDEVLVAFDRGALDHPYVIGGLYNGVDKPGTSDVTLYDRTSGRINRHTLADRSGNRLDLLDEATGKRGVRLSTGDDALTVHMDRTGTAITVRSDGSVTIHGNTTVSVKAGHELNLEAGRSISIKSGARVNIDAGQGISLKTGGMVGIDATGTVNIKALGSAELSALGAVNISAAATVGIKSATIPLLGFVTANGSPVI